LAPRASTPRRSSSSRSTCSPPCALGGILTEETIASLRAKIVCGGANNQLAKGDHAGLLAARGCLYVPDYLANAGGVIDFHQERIDDRPEAVMRAVGRIFPITLEVLEQARAAGRTPLAVAEEIVAGRLTAARASRPAA
jgi:glutamate dehydrogenase/leucine dehydrogenase